MARGAGQSFLRSGAHRLSSHRLSRLYRKWAALKHSSTSCACTCTMQGKHATPNGARRAALSWDEFLSNSRFSRVVALGSMPSQVYYPAFPPG